MNQKYALAHKQPTCGYYCGGCKFYSATPSWNAQGICKQQNSGWYGKTVHIDFSCLNHTFSQTVKAKTKKKGR